MKDNKKTLVYVIIAVIVVALLGIGIFFILKNNTGAIPKSIKNEIVTAENYEELMERIGKEAKDDEEIYYLSYSVMYYMMKDGFANAFNQESDESVMYASIYGKTVEQLISEGKQLMKDNNITVEEFKKNLENAANEV